MQNVVIVTTVAGGFAFITGALISIFDELKKMNKLKQEEIKIKENQVDILKIMLQFISKY